LVRAQPNKAYSLNQTVTSMSALGLDVHGKDPEPVSDEEQSSDEESEVSDTGSEARAGRRARVRRAEDEDDKDQPDELEPWVVPEQKEDDPWAKAVGPAWDENDTSGWFNQPAGTNAGASDANANAWDPEAAPSTSQTGQDEAPTQTTKPARNKGDKIKREKREKKDKKEGPSKPKQEKPKVPKPKLAMEGSEGEVAKVDEGDSKGKNKRSGGYVNHERVKTGGSERVSPTQVP
jgi:hypothetical protein